MADTTLVLNWVMAANPWISITVITGCCLPASLPRQRKRHGSFQHHQPLNTLAWLYRGEPCQWCCGYIVHKRYTLSLSPRPQRRDDQGWCV